MIYALFMQNVGVTICALFPSISYGWKAVTANTAVWKSLQKKYIISISIHKNPIFEGALSRTFTIFSGLVENLLESPQKFLPPSPAPRNTKKTHVFQILDIF